MVLVYAKGERFPRDIKSTGLTVDLVARVHKRIWIRDGCLLRNFTVEYRWSAGGRFLYTAPLAVRVVKDRKGERWNYECWDPIDQKKSTLHALGARIKGKRCKRGGMDGMVGDHNKGWKGWGKLDWGRLRVKKAGVRDADAGRSSELLALPSIFGNAK